MCVKVDAAELNRNISFSHISNSDRDVFIYTVRAKTSFETEAMLLSETPFIHMLMSGAFEATTGGYVSL